MLEFTVAIATWNRAKLLDRTLTQMHRLRIPPGVEWELLVVNNNCTDQTDTVISNHKRDLPIRRLFEPTPGLASARNHVAGNARGKWTLWTDDDVLVDPEWLAAYHEAAQRWPDAGYFGGLIEPWFERPPPGWILANRQLLEGVLVIRDLGPEEHYLSESEEPWGANMAVRSELFTENRFDPKLGVMQNGGYLGEEVEFIKSLRSKGMAGVWVPRARVKHFITKQRLKRGFVWKRFYQHGRTATYLTRTIFYSTDGISYLEGAPQLGKKWGGVPRWLYRKAVELWMLAHWKRLRSEKDWLAIYTHAAFLAGSITEARRQVRESRPPTAAIPSVTASR